MRFAVVVVVVVVVVDVVVVVVVVVVLWTTKPLTQVDVCMGCVRFSCRRYFAAKWWTNTL